MKPSAEFCESIVAFRAPLVRYARRFAGEEAEDIVQDAMVLALTGHEHFRGGDIKGWLATIVMNRFLTKSRTAAFRKRVSHMVRYDDLQRDEALDELEVRDLQKRVALLSEEQRKTILSFALGFDYAEIAAICGVAMGTVKSRIARARAAMECA